MASGPVVGAAGWAGRAHGWERSAPARWARRTSAVAGDPPCTQRRGTVTRNFIAPSRAEAGHRFQNDCQTSASASPAVLRDRSIRKEIMGLTLHTRIVFRASADGDGDAGGAFALLQKQARDGGIGLVRQPLIEQRANLLAEIGGVGQARQLKALQRVLRSRKQELPGWLKRPGGQRALQCAGIASVNNNKVIQRQEYLSLIDCGNLWKIPGRL
jgi:hypothetical protein